MSNDQERLANLLYGFSASTPDDFGRLAAAILDSDVIREIQAEAWSGGWISRRHYETDGTPRTYINPYRGGAGE